jgi:hypothetical protein
MNTTLSVYLEGLGLLGPGLSDWASAAPVLAQGQWQSSPLQLPAPQRLPAAERRRAGAVVKLSIAVADQACTQAGVDPQALATVFSSSSGDGANCHALCEVLASSERAVSPTRFTNSVHNAPAGYWHIATHSRAPSTSLCAHDASFAAGLLEAVVQTVSQQRAVLLVASDVPYPEPLQGVRHLPDALGVALLLSPVATPHSVARLSIALVSSALGPVERCADAGLEALRSGIPAARALPLLQALASLQTTPASQVTVEYLPETSLLVTVVAP